MKPISMVDLINQHNRLRKELDPAINKVIDQAAFIQGNEVTSFEKELASLLNSRYCISCANGTDALKLALMALDLPRGSEVIIPSFTFVSPAEVTALLGYTPVFADVSPHCFNIDIEKIEDLITDKTRAIIPVHLFGQCADMENILKIADKHNLYVIEDTAQALGTAYTFSDGTQKQAGTMGDIGCTSFFPSKNLGCMGDGGAIFTNNKQLADPVRIFKNHGQDNQTYHYKYIGLNSRLDTMQAAVLNVKLPQLRDFIVRRQKVAEHYDKALLNNQNVTVPHREEQSTHSFHQYTLKTDPKYRDALLKFLQEKQIPSKVYYPMPLHLHEAYKNNGRFNREELTNSEKLSEMVFSLPVHTEMEEDQLQYITANINQFFTGS